MTQETKFPELKKKVKAVLQRVQIVLGEKRKFIDTKA